MRIGVFGGTFDPVHYGHLLIAEQAREQAELDQVWFIPAARPPHKSDRSVTPFDRRAEMLSLAPAGQEDKFRVLLVEKDRPGPSFTADTLDALHAENPKNDLFLILGADALKDVPIWHDPVRIIDRATILVAGRPGHVVWSSADLAGALGVDVKWVRVRAVEVPLIEIASHDLRRRAAEGRSLLFQLPRAVEVYVREKKLYRASGAA